MTERPAFLTRDEIIALCDPLTQRGAMLRHLRDMGLIVKETPSGWPIVGRAHFDQVMGARPSSAPRGPNLGNVRTLARSRA